MVINFNFAARYSSADPHVWLQGASSSICEPTSFPFLEIPWQNRTRPTGGVAAAILFINLHLNPRQGRTFREHVQDFDFVGLILIVAGVVLLLLGFNETETSCTSFFFSFQKRGTFLIYQLCAGSSPKTISMLTVGVVLLVACAVNEIYTTRSPIVPPRLFKVSL